MRYIPTANGKSPRVLAGIAAAAALAAIIAARLVPAYQWIYDLTAVVALTVFLYVLTRYSIRFSYALEPCAGLRFSTLTPEMLRGADLRRIEFLVRRQKGSGAETVEGRFYLSELIAAENWPADAGERRALCRKRPEMRLFRYTVSIRPADAMLLVFEDEGYGTVGVLIEPGEALGAILCEAARLNVGGDAE